MFGKDIACERNIRERELWKAGSTWQWSSGGLVLCHTYSYGWIGPKAARCKESPAKAGFAAGPLSRRDAADGRFETNPAGGGYGAMGIVARRQRMSSYAVLLASRPRPPSPASTRNCRCDRALDRGRKKG